MNAPVTLFTYNRLKHTRETVDALKQNEGASETDLIIFSDGAANDTQKESVHRVRDYLKTITGFKSLQIIEREKNYGLGNNIIEGVTEIINKHGKIIVLEDDLITSPYFLRFMNDGLRMYEKNEKVISVHGYVYPVKVKLPETFFLKGADCLGWATWIRGWEKFESNGKALLEQIKSTNQEYLFDYKGTYPYTKMLEDQIKGKNSSWAVRWYASAFLKDLYTLYPSQSLVFHAGSDGSGTNSGFDQQLDVRLRMSPVVVENKDVVQETIAYNSFLQVLQRLAKPPLLYRIKRKFNMFLKNVKQSSSKE